MWIEVVCNVMCQCNMHNHTVQLASQTLNTRSFSLPLSTFLFRPFGMNVRVKNIVQLNPKPNCLSLLHILCSQHRTTNTLSLLGSFNLCFFRFISLYLHSFRLLVWYIFLFLCGFFWFLFLYLFIRLLCSFPLSLHEWRENITTTLTTAMKWSAKFRTRLWEMKGMLLFWFAFKIDLSRFTKLHSI